MKEKIVDGLEFKMAEPTDIPEQEINLCPQVLDGQWVPSSVLKDIKEGNTTIEESKSKIQQLARQEYINSILTGDRVIINRGFFATSPAITKDYDDESSRESLRALLNDGVIVPYLYNEPTPAVNPAFDHDSGMAKKWNEDILKESKPTALRMSWDDAKNDKIIRDQLNRQFSDRIVKCSSLNPEPVHSLFGLPSDQDTIDAFSRCRKELSEYAEAEGRDQLNFVTREKIYKKFICQERTKVSNRVYDFSKPFVSELKQLVDLAYNVNGPDSIKGRLITAPEAPNRLALQEISPGGGRITDIEQITNIFSHVEIRSVVEKLRHQLTLLRLSHLPLKSVIQARGTREWRAYRDAFREIIRTDCLNGGEPEKFGDLFVKSTGAYIDLLEALRRTAVNQAFGDNLNMAIDVAAFGVTITAHLHGMPFLQYILIANGISKIARFDPAKYLGNHLSTDIKQCCLSIAFWSEDARAIKRPLLNLEVASNPIEVRRDMVREMELLLRDMRRKMGIPLIESENSPLIQSAVVSTKDPSNCSR